MNIKKTTAILSAIILLLGCKEEHKTRDVTPASFKYVLIDCDPNTELPKYDESMVQIVDPETREFIKDTTILIPRSNPIFKPCRKFIYQATYLDKNNNLLSDQELLLFSTGKRWSYGGNMQMELVYYYKEPEKIDQKIYTANQYPVISKNVGKSMSGVIDNDKKVWIHPFRDNQYSFTEICPFPEIKAPFVVGKSWSSSLNIGQGWGVWNGVRIDRTYKIVEKASLKLPFSDKPESVFIVKAQAKFSAGTSQAEFTFSENYGFVKTQYTLYNGEKLVMDLIDVQD